MGKARPNTAAVVPSYMRAKTDTLHHGRLTAQQQEQQRRMSANADEGGGSSSLHAAAAAASGGSLNSSGLYGQNQQQQPGVFHSTYEVSYTSPTRDNRLRGQRASSATPAASSSSPPPHVNPASRREMQKHLRFTSRDVPIPTEASQYLIDFQHHMRNISKAEVSRNVRKTEPPNLAKIFKGPYGEDPDDASARELGRRKIAKMREEDEERLRHRSLLYDTEDYHARRGTAAPALSNSPNRRHRNRNGGHGSSYEEEGPTTVASVLNLGAAKATRGRAASAAPPFAVEASRGSPTSKGTTAAANTSTNELYSSSPQRYRKAFFNVKQFERHAPEGWDRVARLANLRDRQQRLNESSQWQHDWTQSISPYEDAAVAQKAVNSVQRDLNRSGAAGLRSDRKEVSRRQFIGGVDERPRRDLPAQHTEAEIADLMAAQQPHYHNNNNNNNNNNNGVAHKNNNARTTSLPKSVRDHITSDRTPNDVVMRYVVDPVLRMELVEKQRNWRGEYARLKDEFADEAGRKAAALREIEELQKGREKFDRTASTVYFV